VLDNSDIKNMVIGIAIFVGGMVTVILLKNYFDAGGMSFKKRITVLKPASTVLEEIKEEIEREKPVGEIVSNLSVNVTDAIVDLCHQKEGFPWSSFDLTNVGPSPVYFSVNHWDSPEAPLPVGQSINVDLKKQGAIKRVYLKCDQGLNTVVSLYVVR